MLHGGLWLSTCCVKTQAREPWCQNHLADESLYALLKQIDDDLVRMAQRGDCPRCGGRLDRSDYPRKPRGGAAWPEDPKRLSLCCDVEGCRRRLTPASVRFLGRRVYVGFVVVLVAAMHHGLSPQRVERVRGVLGVDRRTMIRWRDWWLRTFVASAFWREVRARFMPPVSEASLPWSLCEQFTVERRDRLLDLLRFLAPITTLSAPERRGM